MAVGDGRLILAELRELLKRRDALKEAMDSDALQHLSPRVALAVAKLMGDLDRVAAEVAERAPETARSADREAFLKMKDSLLADHRGMFVAFANGELVAARPSLDELHQGLAGLDAAIDVYIERVEDEAFLEPPELEDSGLHELVPAGTPGRAGDEQPEPVTDRESFLRMKDFLLKHYRDMFVAFAGGRVVGASKSLDELWERLDSIQPSADLCIEPVNEEAFEQTGPNVMTGVYGVHEVT